MNVEGSVDSKRVKQEIHKSHFFPYQFVKVLCFERLPLYGDLFMSTTRTVTRFLLTILHCKYKLILLAKQGKGYH